MLVVWLWRWYFLHQESDVGTLRQMIKYATNFRRYSLSTIFITHLHVDHASGLAAVIADMGASRSSSGYFQIVHANDKERCCVDIWHQCFSPLSSIAKWINSVTYTFMNSWLQAKNWIVALYLLTQIKIYLHSRVPMWLYQRSILMMTVTGPVLT